MKRTVNILSINDAHSFALTDGGVDKEGAPTSSRQNVLRALAKRIDVNGRMMPVFRVESVGGWLDARNAPLKPTMDQLAIHIDTDDRLENAKLDDSGKSREWLAERAKRVEKSAERRRYAEGEVERARSGDIAQAITQMVRAVDTKTAPAAKPQEARR